MYVTNLVAFNVLSMFLYSHAKKKNEKKTKINKKQKNHTKTKRKSLQKNIQKKNKKNSWCIGQS